MTDYYLRLLGWACLVFAGATVLAFMQGQARSLGAAAWLACIGIWLLHRYPGSGPRTRFGLGLRYLWFRLTGR
jgi:hypothetical protein